MKTLLTLTLVLLVPNALLFGAGQDDTKEGKALLVAGEYEKAFPLLAKGSDKDLKALADLELAKPTDFMATAKAWADAVKKVPGPLKLPVLDRAVYWYGKQWHSTADEKEKAELRRIFTKIEPIPPGAEKFGKQQQPITGWNPPVEKNGGTFDEAVTRNGRRAVKLVPSASGTSFIGTVLFPSIPGQKYVVSAWVLSTADGDARLESRVFNRDTQQIGGGATVIPQDTPFWQKVSKVIETPAEAFRMDVLFIGKFAAGAVWVDDVSVTLEGKEILKNGNLEDR